MVDHTEVRSLRLDKGYKLSAADEKRSRYCKSPLQLVFPRLHVRSQPVNFQTFFLHHHCFVLGDGEGIVRKHWTFINK